MKKKSLKDTNPYLKDPELREALINLSVPSSTTVEGIRAKYPKLSKKAVITVHEPSTSYE